MNFQFPKKLFLETCQQILLRNCKCFFNKVSVPKSSYEDVRICDGDLKELEQFQDFMSMESNKSLGNDRLTKEFYKRFWNKIKKLSINSITEAREKRP